MGWIPVQRVTIGETRKMMINERTGRSKHNGQFGLCYLISVNIFASEFATLFSFTRASWVVPCFASFGPFPNSWTLDGSAAALILVPTVIRSRSDTSKVALLSELNQRIFCVKCAHEVHQIVRASKEYRCELRKSFRLCLWSWVPKGPWFVDLCKPAAQLMMVVRDDHLIFTPDLCLAVFCRHWTLENRDP